MLRLTFILGCALLLALVAADSSSAGSKSSKSSPPEPATSTSDTATKSIENCLHVIVGAGWSGSYYAWRTAVDENHPHSADATCIFEATDRIGGRAYSKANIPGMEDLRVDLGAYRFDTHQMPLSNHIITKVLNLPTRCYDRSACNNYGNLQVIRDAYNNPKGYANGPEQLIQLVLQKGGRIFFNHRLTSIEDNNDETNKLNKPIRLRFENGVTIECKSVFLNMPSTAINYLNPKSILFTKANKDSRKILKLPQEENGAKLFLIYQNAIWRHYPDFTEGLFGNVSLIPPMKGRFHDFYGKCPPGSIGTSCWGAILYFYDFTPSNTSYYAQFQQDESDPYTYLPYEENSKQYDMITNAHLNFIGALKLKNPNISLDDIPPPEGAIVSIWWNRSSKSALFPGVSQLRSQPNGPVISDPNHIIRNRISKPLDNYDIYIANEAFSTGDGWAHPSLILTERILFHYLKNKPKWVDQTCVDCFSTTTIPCEDCVSNHWYQMEIEVHPPSSSASCTSELCPTEITYSGSGSSIECPAFFHTPQLKLSWQWINSTDIQITFQMNSTGWVGFGFGSSMGQSDLIVAYKNKVELRVGRGYTEPSIIDQVNNYLYNTNIKTDGQTKIVTFSRRMVVSNTNYTFQNISLTDATPILIASGPEIPTKNNLKQHTFQMQHVVSLYCQYQPLLKFETDIKPLFREKDQKAMKFQFDLYDEQQVLANADEIYERLEDKTIFGLATGMPPDITWSVENLNLFKRWLEQAKSKKPSNESSSSSSSSSSAGTVTFADIVKFFRPFDVQSMLPFKLNLLNYTHVKNQAQRILDSVESGRMPCTADARWTPDMVNKFKQWMKDGYPEGNVLPTDRETFYRMKNIDAFPEFIPLARQKLESFLQQARDLMNSPDAPARRWSRFNFTARAFDQRMDEIYSDLAYEATQEPNMTLWRSLDHVTYRIRQLAPFNLIDGGWLSNCCPSGPINEVYSMLWGILNDEMGGDDLDKNHCLLYQELLNSVGIYLPDVNTHDFAYDPLFLDSAFTSPSYSLLISHFTREYFPELLGTTLQIEWCVLGLWDTLHVLRHWGVNGHFYELHIGIDNAVAGHGWRAKRAVELYLDQIRALEGEDAVQEHFYRIWTGYVAYDGLGTLGDDLMNYLEKTPTPADEVIAMMQRKAKYGGQNHLERRVGSTKINQLFMNTSKFLNELQQSAWVVYGSPDASPLMNYLTSFEGPMFKVFDEKDLNIWRNWIYSLKDGTPQPENPILDSFDAMKHMIERVSRVGRSVTEHNVYQLWGPSPNNGELIKQSVATWLSISTQEDGGNPVNMLRALIQPENALITCGDTNSSAFAITILEPSNAMGRVYSRYAADVLGDKKHPSPLWTWKDIVVRWIEDGCPFESNGGFSLFPSPPSGNSGHRRTSAFKKAQVSKGGISKQKQTVKRKTGPGRYFVH